MSLMEKIRNIMEIPEDEDYDEEDEETDSMRSGDGASPQKGQRPESDRCGKVLNINATANLQVYVVKPEQLDDAGAIADLLKDMRIIVLNLETTNREIAHRILDFLGGVVYAYNGQIKRIANNTFLIAPYNVEIMGNLLDDLQSNDWNIPEN